MALKFFYRKLELKSGLLETEFRGAIDKLTQAILDYYKIPYDKITQTWTRNMISNDLENAQIAQASIGLLPRKLNIRNHPWVDDYEEALELLEEEEKEQFEDYNFLEDDVKNGEINE